MYISAQASQKYTITDIQWSKREGRGSFLCMWSKGGVIRTPNTTSTSHVAPTWLINESFPFTCTLIMDMGTFTLTTYVWESQHTKYTDLVQIQNQNVTYNILKVPFNAKVTSPVVPDSDFHSSQSIPSPDMREVHAWRLFRVWQRPRTPLPDEWQHLRTLADSTILSSVHLVFAPFHSCIWCNNASPFRGIQNRGPLRVAKHRGLNMLFNSNCDN